MAASAVAGAVLLPLATGIGVNFYLLQKGQNRLWLGDMVSLFWIKLPLSGAIFGILSAALCRGLRPLFLRCACAIYPLVVAGLTTKWVFAVQFDLRLLWPRELLFCIALPTLFWALGILFFALVTRTRRDLPSISDTD